MQNSTLRASLLKIRSDLWLFVGGDKNLARPLTTILNRLEDDDESVEEEVLRSLKEENVLAKLKKLRRTAEGTKQEASIDTTVLEEALAELD